MILSDRDILKRLNDKQIKISPFNRGNLQPSTYDLTLSSKIRVFYNFKSAVIDVKNPEDVSQMIDVGKKGYFIIHPQEFILCSTVEKVALPADIAAKLEGRSSLGRLGLIIHATAGYIDPGFFGQLTLEVSNISRLPIKLYPKMRIAQISFVQMSSPVLNLYGSKKLGSKYQNQKDPTKSMIWKDFNRSD